MKERQTKSLDFQLMLQVVSYIKRLSEVKTHDIMK